MVEYTETHKIYIKPTNQMKTETDNIFPIGTTEGNQIEIDDIGKGEYRLICRDHFSQNFVDYYVHRNNLKGLADFINRYLQSE
jgi:hypothetical protein